MNRLFRISFAIVAVLLMTTVSGQADRGGHGGGHGGGMGWGPVIGLGIGLGLLGLTYPYYGNPYYSGYGPAPVIQQPAAEMYVQPSPQQSSEPNYWYYCQSPEGYYPYVKHCPGGWMQVVPTSPGQ